MTPSRRRAHNDRNLGGRGSGRLEVRILGAHQTESRDTGCFSILIDGALAIDAGSLTRSLTFAEQRQIKALLLTHQHYDHVKDVALIGFNGAWDTTLDIWTTEFVQDVLNQHILCSPLWLSLTEIPSAKPAIRFHTVHPGETYDIAGYEVRPARVPHSVFTVGFQVSKDGAAVFYTADSGPGLRDAWPWVRPDLILAEVTYSNAMREDARDHTHLTAELLGEELEAFRQLHGYLPPIGVVHVNHRYEGEIAGEVAAVARKLDIRMWQTREGEQIPVVPLFSNEHRAMSNE